MLKYLCDIYIYKLVDLTLHCRQKVRVIKSPSETFITHFDFSGSTEKLRFERSINFSYSDDERQPTMSARGREKNSRKVL